MKKFFAEFKEFIAKGNVLDMAIGVVIGGAFKEIVNALVNNIIMPLIGKVTGGVSVEEWKWVLEPAVVENGAEVSPEVAVLYGGFIQTIIDFLIIAFCIFVTLKVVLALQSKTKALLAKKEEEEAAAAEPEVPAETEMDVLKDIRELLVKQAEK
jgi:large conductance mechanosensitive channel